MQIAHAHSSQLHHFLVSAQTFSFVDDFYIYDIEDKRASYYQLKTNTDLSWGSKFKTLFFDFNKQKNHLRYLKRKFRLYLVVANIVVHNKMLASLPSRLKKYTQIEFFPLHDSINSQLTNDAQFKSVVTDLCALSDLNKLEALATCILGAWEATNKNNIPVSDILNSIRNMGYSYLKRNIPLYISSGVDNILCNIPAFSYEIKGGYLSWTYGTADKGDIPWSIDSAEFRNIEAEIMKKAPKTFDDLENIIS